MCVVYVYENIRQLGRDWAMRIDSLTNGTWTEYDTSSALLYFISNIVEASFSFYRSQFNTFLFRRPIQVHARTQCALFIVRSSTFDAHSEKCTTTVMEVPIAFTFCFVVLSELSFLLRMFVVHKMICEHGNGNGDKKTGLCCRQDCVCVWERVRVQKDWKDLFCCQLNAFALYRYPFC